MADKNKNNAWDAAFKSMQKDIKDWGDIQADRNKITAQVMINEMKTKNNAIYNLQEKKQSAQIMTPIEQEQLNYQQDMRKRGESGDPGVYRGAKGWEELRMSPDAMIKATLIQKGDKRDAADNAKLEALGWKPEGQAITDAKGNIIGHRPKGSVFQPKNTSEEMGFLEVESMEEAIKPNVQLPEGVTEDDIQHTLKLHPEYNRESLLKKLGGR